MYEDRYWCDYITSLFTDFTIAPIETAIKFSFEAQPSLLYQMNSNVLPFGCHAWEKYEPEFWEPFVKSQIYLNDD
jgi:hypothetical protein